MANAAAKLKTREGYNILHWQYAGMEYWAVTDAAAEDLQHLAQLMQ
jgi:anti-sigma factor RsiW